MENKSAHSSIWNPVATAPANVELELCIYDSGEYHALACPAGAMAWVGLMCASIRWCQFGLPTGDRGSASTDGV